MTHPDRTLIRAKDIGLIVGILTVCGMLWKVGLKPFEWEQNTKEIAELKQSVKTHDLQLAQINAQYTSIKDELRSINRKLGR